MVEILKWRLRNARLILRYDNTSTCKFRKEWKINEVKRISMNVGRTDLFRKFLSSPFVTPA